MKMSKRTVTSGRTSITILSAINEQVNASNKATIEQQLEQYARHNIYPEKGLHVFSSVHQDTASITIIIELNDIQDQVIT
jgi:hypothetical protein